MARKAMVTARIRASRSTTALPVEKLTARTARKIAAATEMIFNQMGIFMRSMSDNVQ